MRDSQSSIEYLIRNAFWNFQRVVKRWLPYSKIKNVSISLNSKMSNVELVRDFQHELSFINYKQELLPARRLVKIENVVANSRTGVIWSNGRILKESTVWPVIDLLQWEPKPFMAKKLSGSFILLPDNGFYHFLIEELPRFLDAFTGNETSTVLYGSRSSYLMDFIKIANLANRASYLGFPVKVPSLFLSEKSLGGIATTRDIEKLKDFFRHFISKGIESEASIFISRRGSAKDFERGLKHYLEVERLMVSLGVLVIYLEDYSLQEQIQLVSNTQNLIGFHGAGLSNLIWMREKSRVVEVIYERQTAHFEHLSTLAGHEYVRMHINQLLDDPLSVLKP